MKIFCYGVNRNALVSLFMFGTIFGTEYSFTSARMFFFFFFFLNSRSEIFFFLLVFFSNSCKKNVQYYIEFIMRLLIPHYQIKKKWITFERIKPMAFFNAKIKMIRADLLWWICFKTHNIYYVPGQTCCDNVKFDLFALLYLVFLFWRWWRRRRRRE